MANEVKGMPIINRTTTTKKVKIWHLVKAECEFEGCLKHVHMRQWLIIASPGTVHCS